MNKHFPKLLLISLSLLLFIGLTNAKPALQEKKFNGFLFSKLTGIGTRSEGPSYYLQYRNYKETKIIKHVNPWQRDPELEKFLGRNVQISGVVTNKIIDYQEIKPWNP